MKKWILAAVATLLFSAQAFAACEQEAANHISQKYSVNVLETRDLGGGGGGQGSVRDREVWVKDDAGSTYSVFFFAGNCGSISRDIKWN